MPIGVQSPSHRNHGDVFIAHGTLGRNLSLPGKDDHETDPVYFYNWMMPNLTLCSVTTTLASISGPHSWVFPHPPFFKYPHS